MLVKLEIEDGPDPAVVVRFDVRHITDLDMKDTTDRHRFAPAESVLTIGVAGGSTLSLRDVGDFELMRRLCRMAFPMPEPSPKPREPDVTDTRKPLIGTRRRGT